MDTNIGIALIEIVAPLARNATIKGVISGDTNVDTVVIPTENATSSPQK